MGCHVSYISRDKNFEFFIKFFKKLDLLRIKYLILLAIEHLKKLDMFSKSLNSSLHNGEVASRFSNVFTIFCLSKVYFGLFTIHLRSLWGKRLDGKVNCPQTYTAQ